MYVMAQRLRFNEFSSKSVLDTYGPLGIPTFGVAWIDGNKCNHPIVSLEDKVDLFPKHMIKEKFEEPQILWHHNNNKILTYFYYHVINRVNRRQSYLFQKHIIKDKFGEPQILWHHYNIKMLTEKHFYYDVIVILRSPLIE